MQMKALRSRNFAKLSSSNSTSDEYWVTSISAGTPAGYCLSQMRSMVFPLLVCFPDSCGPGRLVLGSIEQCGGRWQAAARYRARRRWSESGPASAGRNAALSCAARRSFDPPGWLRRSCSWAWRQALRRPWAWPAFGRGRLVGRLSGAASGLALACLTAAGLAADFGSGLGVLAGLGVGLGSAAASGFFAATRDFLPRCRGVCLSASAATAAISAAPVLVGPV